MAKTTHTAVDKYFEALTDSYDAILEAIKAGNERGYRISQNLLADAQRGQRESVELGKKFAADPTDVGGLYRAMMESATKAQGRTLELARQIFDELSDSRGETRETFEKVFKASREAGEAAVEATRDVVGTTATRVRTGVGRVMERTGDAVEDAGESLQEGATKAKKTATSTSS